MPSALQPSDAPRAVKTGSPCAGAAGRRPCRRSHGSHAGRCPRARARRRPRWLSLRPRVGHRERSRSWCRRGPPMAGLGQAVHALHHRGAPVSGATTTNRLEAQRRPRLEAGISEPVSTVSQARPNDTTVSRRVPARRTAEVTEDRPSRGGCPDSGTPPVPRRHRDTPPGGRRAPRGRSATRRAQHPRSPAPAAGGACGR